MEVSFIVSHSASWTHRNSSPFPSSPSVSQATVNYISVPTSAATTSNIQTNNNPVPPSATCL